MWKVDRPAGKYDQISKVDGGKTFLAREYLQRSKKMNDEKDQCDRDRSENEEPGREAKVDDLSTGEIAGCSGMSNERPQNSRRLEKLIADGELMQQMRISRSSRLPCITCHQRRDVTRLHIIFNPPRLERSQLFIVTW